MTKNNKWINVKDKLPEDKQEVEVKFLSFRTAVIFHKTEYGYKFIKNCDTKKGLFFNIIAFHWRPIQEKLNETV